MQLAHFNPNIAEPDMVTQHLSVLVGNRIVLQKILLEQEEVYDNFLTDDYFERILLYLGIMTNRIQKGAFLEAIDINNNTKIRMAQDILKYCAQYCNVSSTKDEVFFLSEMLFNSRYMKRRDSDSNTIRVQLLTRRFIEKLSEELGVNLNNDYDFFENLSNHMESVLSATPPHYPDIPIIEEVTKENPDIITAVMKELPMVKRYANRDITEIEVGYIAIHICAALERRKNKEISLHIIVACHAGLGTSHLLLEKLKRHFNFKVVDIISSHEATNIKPGCADFVISTVPIEHCPIDHIVVSPLFSDEDYLRVGNKIDLLRNDRNFPNRIHEKERTTKEILDTIAPTIHQMAPEKADAIMVSLRKELRFYESSTRMENIDIFSPHLHHLLTEDFIQLDVVCTDWKDAVNQSARNLLQRGYIEERYIDAMITNIERNGPYIVLTKGFALPHDGLEMGSIKLGMNLIRLKTSTSFYAGELDPVEYVCCMSVVDYKTHLKAFFNLVNMLKTKEFLPQLSKCQTSKKAALLIEEYEHKIMDSIKIK